MRKKIPAELNKCLVKVFGKIKMIIMTENDGKRRRQNDKTR